MKIKLTKLEAEAVWHAAGNMKDDMEYFNFIKPKSKFIKFCEAYETGMRKLAEVMTHSNKK